MKWIREKGDIHDMDDKSYPITNVKNEGFVSTLAKQRMKPVHNYYVLHINRFSNKKYYIYHGGISSIYIRRDK